jgi:hypothetical protein
VSRVTRNGRGLRVGTRDDHDSARTREAKPGRILAEGKMPSKMRRPSGMHTLVPLHRVAILPAALCPRNRWASTTPTGRAGLFSRGRHPPRARSNIPGCIPMRNAEVEKIKKREGTGLAKSD